MGVFLFFSLLFPRISLFIAWLSGGIPVNNVPFFFDIISAISFPRLLIIYYIWYAELGIGWMVAHILALIIRLMLKSIDDLNEILTVKEFEL